VQIIFDRMIASMPTHQTDPNQKGAPQESNCPLPQLNKHLQPQPGQE